MKINQNQYLRKLLRKHCSSFSIMYTQNNKYKHKTIYYNFNTEKLFFNTNYILYNSLI